MSNLKNEFFQLLEQNFQGLVPIESAKRSKLWRIANNRAMHIVKEAAQDGIYLDSADADILSDMITKRDLRMVK